MKKKANVNAKNKLGRTPLHYASGLEEDFFESQGPDGTDPQIVRTIKILLDAGKLKYK